MKLGDVTHVIGGELHGDAEVELIGISSPRNPRQGSIVFCQSEEDIGRALAGGVSALVVNREVDFPNYIKVDDVRYALALFLDRFYPEEHPVGVSEKAEIGNNVSLGKDVYVAPFVFLGENVVLEDNVKVYPFTYIGANTVVGEGSVIFSGVHVYPNTLIGKGVRIHSGSVIGADGFGYHIGREGIRKLNHIGNVIIEDFVEIGANTTVDRAMIDSTRVGKFTKLDNLVMIAHNCDIGEGNIIVGQVGISGSVKTGKGVVLAGQVGVADHIEIGDNVTVTAKSGVSRSLEAGKVYGATLPAVEWSRWKRIYASLLRLPELLKRLK
ncbi:UDP-3-O-(3-hydroxymyristoyl)glucosamine N-acyltransferase [Hydrogenivirga sp. 128-5-R1-1]|uniref:UDP-3-O-(3-hydroxymyristoyl)glucosamine N-acyltransferase n=1 Tax=Hydrogenivirga sp. 128-5-R1-1 TaxID=392423 RepID=UPI00015EF855|nr:UDP-3-O-(3-hydroxymyristoyl)glucosamine N-acyltransferase [Hydrogenivirga sp. 128-5-R1-1]EDP75674.1 UDP-3-O-[3-hydroxymyristoyl] glucosamine N acyltransferase [Hydrogenivirga sp. 128-5-R1-1]